MNHHRENMLMEMGLGPVWTLRQTVQASALALPSQKPTQNAGPVPAGASLSADIPVHQATAEPHDIAGNQALCSECGRSHAGVGAAFAVPAAAANCLFIYENPIAGAHDQAQAFTATANILFANILRALDMQKGANACIASIVKSAPGKDSAAQVGEIAVCSTCLKQQITLLKPSIIVSLGGLAAISLLALDSETSMSHLRGQLRHFDGVPLMVTYDPEYLLANPREKNVVWSDLCLALNAIAVH